MFTGTKRIESYNNTPLLLLLLLRATQSCRFSQAIGQTSQIQISVQVEPREDGGRRILRCSSSCQYWPPTYRGRSWRTGGDRSPRHRQQHGGVDGNGGRGRAAGGRRRWYRGRHGHRRVRVQAGRGTDPPRNTVRRPRSPGPQRTGAAPAGRPTATAPVGGRRPGVDRPQPMGRQAHVRAGNDHAGQRFHARRPGAQDAPVVAGSSAENPKVSNRII